jgi:hypothetical protein
LLYYFHLFILAALEFELRVCWAGSYLSHSQALFRCSYFYVRVLCYCPGWPD